MHEKKFEIYGVQIPGKFVESKHFHSCHSRFHSKLAPKFLSLHPRQREIAHSSKQRFLKKLFPQEAEKGVT